MALRGDIERLAIASILQFPFLIEEAEIKENDFADFGALFAGIVDNLYSGAIDLVGASVSSPEQYAEAANVSVFSEDQARKWVGRLVDCSIARSIDSEIRKASSSKLSGADKIVSLKRAISNSERRSAAVDVPTLDEITSDFLASARREIASGRPSSIRVGLRVIDVFCKGLRPGDLTLIASEGGCGKSTFISYLLRKAAENGANSYLASAEMSNLQLGEREAGIVAGKDLSERWDAIDDVDRAGRVLQASRETLERVSVDTTWEIIPARLEAQVNRVAGLRGVDLVAVDHIDHVSMPGLDGVERVSGAILSLKGLAKKLQVPVIVAGHINRTGEMSGNTPSKAWLRGSTHLGQVPDNIIILTRDIAHGSCDTVAWCLKSRQGITGSVNMSYNTRYGVYAESS